MARSNTSNVVFIGVGSHAVAIHALSGEELWRTKLKSSTFVTIAMEGDKLYAGASGELFCLDPSSGQIIWHNKLKGLGLGVVAFAGSNQTVSQAAALAGQTAAGSM